MKAQAPISKALTVTLWIAQGLLAALFLYSAGMKLLMPADKLAAMWPWTAGNHGLVVLTAILDIMAGLGLILPVLLNILPGLTFYAALGAIALMAAAIIFHVSRGEASLIGLNIFALLAAVFVAWGRR